MKSGKGPLAMVVDKHVQDILDSTAMKLITALKISVLLLILSLVGCAPFWTGDSSTIAEREDRRLLSVGEEHLPPPGVVRYCWAEPEVAYEKLGPGVDTEGKWYHPSYSAVRQVKGGQWYPCDRGPGR